MQLVLASASARRRELLTAAGLAFVVAPPRVDETCRSGESAAAYVERLALEKADWARQLYPRDVVLGADTTVVVDDYVLGKPDDDADARAMLTRLSGRAHEVLTGVALAWPDGRQSLVERTCVWFGPLTESEIDWYVSSGEPRDKAGAYAIQGLASRFVMRIEGSYSNVVGLPVAAVLQLLKATGVDLGVFSRKTAP